MRRLDYLVVGHVCKDLSPTGYTIGGTATYSSLTARNMRARVGVVTSAASDLELDRALSGIEVYCLPSANTTVYENIYLDGTRRQMLRAVAEPLSSASVPPSWRDTSIVHLGPLAQEVSEDLVQGWGDALVGVTPQGWMRQWDANGRVSPCRWERAAEIAQKSDVVILSEEDVGGEWDEIEALARWTKTMVVTSGWQGATVLHQGHMRHFPARVVAEVDPTGAGDIFATAYLIRLRETNDPWRSAQFANCVASFSVERTGIASVPTPHEIDHCRG